MSNECSRVLACGFAITGGALLATLLPGTISAAGGLVVAGVLSSVSGDDLGAVWKRRRHDPRFKHPNEDLTRLIGDAIAAVLFDCARDYQLDDKRARKWCKNIGSYASEKWVALAPVGGELSEVSESKLPEIFAEASSMHDREYELLSPEIWGRVLDNLRDASGLAVNVVAMDFAAARLHSKLFREIRERAKLNFEADGLAYAALTLDMSSAILAAVRELQTGQSELVEGLRALPSQLHSLVSRMLQRLDQNRREQFCGLEAEFSRRHNEAFEYLQSIKGDTDETVRNTRALLTAQERMHGILWENLELLQVSLATCRESLHRRSEHSSASAKRGGTRGNASPRQIGPLAIVTEFEETTKTLLSIIRSDDRIAPILNGAYYPVCLPQCDAADYGTVLDELFLPALKRSYEATFGERRFQNEFGGMLCGELAPVPNCRQEILIETMASGPVVGILFPAALQGFSVNAARQQLTTLPESFVLSGVLDTCVAYIEYPDFLARDDNVPTLVCAGTKWQDRLSLCFHPTEKSLSLCVADESVAIGSYSPCLLYIGT
jgi:hypothetical protein